MKELLPGLYQFGEKMPDGSCGAVYLVGDIEKKDVALVDAASSANFPAHNRELYTKGLRPQDIRAVHITHGHTDHYEGAVLLRRESDATVYMGAQDIPAVNTGDYFKTAGFFYGRKALPLEDVESIGNGYEQRYGGWLVRAIEAPSHTMGSIVYEVENTESGVKVALMGDAAWGGWDEERIGSNLDLWKQSVGGLLLRELTYVSFGHYIHSLVDATPHLEELYRQIGKYGNAYDEIPDQYYDEALALPAVTAVELAA